jgi:hypothetical protein
LIDQFGCETFADMQSVEDFSSFCSTESPSMDGATSLDTLPDCTVGQDRCEWFWTCESL